LIDEMFRPQADAESELGGPTKYGLGWETGSLGELATVQKGGSVLAMATLWYLVPARRFAIALFITRVDYGFVPTLGNLIAVMNGQPPAIPISPRSVPPEAALTVATVPEGRLRRWVGGYDTRNGDAAVFLRGDTLLADYEGIESPLAPLDDSTFALLNDIVEYTGRPLIFRRQNGKRTVWLGKDSIGVEIR
jgi:hypothetical protein